MTVHVFGIRHHGPGCARSLLQALRELEPDIVLVEGPPDAHEVLPLMMDQAMQPPVALLIYAPEAPQPRLVLSVHAFFAGVAGTALRLRARRTGALDRPAAGDPAGRGRRAMLEAAPAAAPAPAEAGEQSPAEATESPVDDEARKLRDDPIGMLAEAAGYNDHELWWEHQIEQRLVSRDLFAGIAEAMTVLRAAAEPPEGREALREAHMRQAIRAAQREGFERIAVVCGAWHVPALSRVRKRRMMTPRCCAA